MPFNPVLPEDDDLTKLIQQGDADQARLKEQNSGYDTTGAITGALAALGAGFQGKDSLAAVGQVQNQRRQARQDEMSALDKWKQNKIEEIKLKRQGTMNQREDEKYAQDQDLLAREKDPSSDESKIAQQAAAKMGYKDDTSGLTAQQFKAFSPAMEKIYQVEQARLARQDALNAKGAAAQAKADSGVTEGRKALDKDYAKDFNDWTSTGRSTLEKNLQALRDASAALDADPSLTGGMTGVLGDRFTADRVLGQRQKVGSAVQNSLKATLGTQFTEKEGERILKNAYNEAADAKTNKTSIDALIKQLEAQAAANDSKANYFQQKGTLTGLENGFSGQAAGPPPVSPEDAMKELERRKNARKNAGTQ